MNVKLMLGLMLFPGLMAAQVLPYQNPQLSHQERAMDLCSRLTLEEKVSLMENASPAIPRLGIKQWNWWNEALHGVGRNGLATVFPITMGMAASFDDELLRQCFDAVSTEARAKNNIARKEGQINIYQCLSFWTPNINIFRDPRWGRGQETYGEDPYLTSRMGLAVVKGLQGEEGGKYQKLYACAKHFAVHSGPEWNRHQFNVEDLPVRDLWETYLPAFKTLVQDGNVREVMCAYQRFDGEPCCGNKRFLQSILRGEWGFRGLVTSDCGAVDDFWRKGYHGFSDSRESAIAHAVITGTDLECGSTYRNLPEAIRQGKITESQIDSSLVRLLYGRFELGDFDDETLVPFQQIGAEMVDCEAHRRLAKRMAEESIVLLQNRGGILPLEYNANIAVVGANAADSTMMWGNYNGFPSHTSTILEGIRHYIPSVRFLEGGPLAEVEDHFAERKEEILKFVDGIDIIVYVGGISPRLEGEEMDVRMPGFRGGDRTSIELPEAQRKVIQLLHDAGKKIIYVNCSGSAIALEPESRNAEAIVQAWYGGQGGGKALADVLFGAISPSGKLPVTFYASTDQLPDYEDYRMQNRTYRYFRGKPLWEFGHGLTYSEFRLGKVRYKKGKVEVEVKNVGDREVSDVLQIYISRPDDAYGPIQVLRGFKRITVPAGKVVTVDVPMNREQFEWWDASSNAMRLLNGYYQVHVGFSSKREMQKSLSVRIDK